MKGNTPPSSSLRGIRKAAILLLSVDEDTASEVLKGLDEATVLAIGAQMVAMVYGVPPGELREVENEVSDFVTKARTHFLTVDSGQKLSAMLGENTERIRSTLDAGELLKRYDSKGIAQVLRGEHPQIVAVVLANMDAKKAKEILEILPAELQFQVVTRLAGVDKVNREFLGEIERSIADQLQSKEIGAEADVGGVEAVAAIFNKLGKDLGTKIMNEIEEKDDDLAGKIKKLMFTFEDLRGLDDRSMQVVLKEVTSEELLLALRQTSDELKQKIFANMSERAAAMLKEDMETHGPARMSEVEAAQSKIASTTKRLADEGKIVVASGEEKFM